MAVTAARNCGGIVDHLRQRLHVPGKRDHLRLVAGLQIVQHLHRFVLGLRQAIPCPHAEGAVDRHDGDLLAVGRARRSGE